MWLQTLQPRNSAVQYFYHATLATVQVMQFLCDNANMFMASTLTSESEYDLPSSAIKLWSLQAVTPTF